MNAKLVDIRVEKMKNEYIGAILIISKKYAQKNKLPRIGFLPNEFVYIPPKDTAVIPVFKL
jgi:hypothetical protein